MCLVAYLIGSGLVTYLIVIIDRFGIVIIGGFGVLLSECIVG
jgi:hypothetical protein